MIYNLFLKFHMRHAGFLFYDLRSSDEGAETDLICNFCWPDGSNKLKITNN